MWSVLRALNPKQHNSERVDLKLTEKENTLNMKGIQYPVSLKDLNKFEKQNPFISITVLGYERKSVYPLRNSDCTDRENNIILLLIEEDGVKHYCLVNIQNIQIGSYTKKVKNKKGETKDETKPLHHQIRFIDSFKFMATSLDKVVNNLSKDAFSNVKRYYAEDKLNLFTRKGIYPYEYMNSPEKLKETKLPPKEPFYSRLNDEGISDENYACTQKVWKTFEMKTLEDYHNSYNQVDVLLLSDVFENFRNICCKH